MVFSVLFVCTGNVCRSPVAARIMTAAVGGRAPIVVSSAGTRALVGCGIDGPSAGALREIGVDGSGHVARWLEPDHIAEADLVLTAQTQHRDFVVRADPMSFRRTFTIREFGRLGSSLGPIDRLIVDKFRERVAAVAAQRGQVDPPPPGSDDIGDPFGGGLETARLCVAQIADAIERIVRALGLEETASERNS